MRIDIVAENPAEAIAGALGLLPKSVVRVVWGFTVARTLLSAVELGVFAALEAGPLTSDELAERLRCDKGGMRTLMSALNGFGVVTRRRGVFRLAKEARRYLTPGGTDLTDALRMGGVLDKKMRHLTEAVRTGERGDFHESLAPEEWDAYLRGLGALSRIATGEVVRKLKLRAPRRMLDVAGGHGQFSVALCEKHEGLTSEILDLPGGARVGRELIADSAAAGRITFREGDLRQVDWGEGFDVVLLFNILHNLSEPDAERAVARAHAALVPGGTLAVLEGQHAGGDGDLSFQEGFGELFFWVLSTSETWPAPTISGWMTAAGFSAVKQRKMLTLPGAVLMTARRGA